MGISGFHINPHGETFSAAFATDSDQAGKGTAARFVHIRIKQHL